MKNFLYAVILLVSLLISSMSSAADAKPFNVHFDRVGLHDFLSIVYNDMLKKSVILSPEVDKLEKLVTFHTGEKSISPDELEKLTGVYLASLGLEAKITYGVAFINLLKYVEPKKTDEPDKEVFLYRLKNRSLSYLADILPAVFPKGDFSFRRSVKSSSASTPLPTAPGAKPADSGISAYSQLDKEADLFTFSATGKEIKRLQAFLAQVDIPEPQVMINAALFEVQSGSGSEQAFKLAVSLLDGKFKASIGGNPASVPNGSISYSGARLDALIGTLETDSRFKLTSRPVLRVKSGASSKLSIGNEVPVLGSVQTDKNGYAFQSVEYKPSGVIVSVKPQIRETAIDLVIDQQVSSFTKTTTGVDNSPTLLKRQIQTELSLIDGEVAVLGGLSEESESGSRSGMTWLPNWMQSKTQGSDKKDLLLIFEVHKL